MTKCFKGHVYWYDSCGEVEEKKEFCENGCVDGKCKQCQSQYQYKCYNGHVYWYDSCGNKGEKKEYCELGCEGNECLPETCTDSDGGIEYYEKGTTTLGALGKTDSCYATGASVKGVTEYYCENNEIKSIDYACPGIDIGDGTIVRCQYGACIEDADDYIVDKDCIDSDGGKDYYEKGILTDNKGYTYEDYCTNDNPTVNLLERFCAADGTKSSIGYLCPNGCEDGACIEVTGTCSDSDGGIEYFEKGITTIGSETKTDYCYGKGASSAGVIEFYCDDNEIKSVEYDCPYIDLETHDACEDGACVEEQCFDSDDGKDIFTKGYIMIGYYDRCYDSQSVYETYCENSKPYMTIIACGGDCIDGKCLTQEELGCTDSDGDNYFVKGEATGSDDLTTTDRCTTPNEDHATEDCPVGEECLLAEAVCHVGKANTVFIPCPNGCEDGACIETDAECYDTDGGEDYYNKGSVFTPDGSFYENDACVIESQDGNINILTPIYDYDKTDLLMEKVCENGEPKSIFYECPNGCNAGYCIS